MSQTAYELVPRQRIVVSSELNTAKGSAHVYDVHTHLLRGAAAFLLLLLIIIGPGGEVCSASVR